MSISGAHASAFFEEALREGQVWTIRDSGGIPAPMGSNGVGSMPFWSLASRAERIISTVEAYASFEKVSIPLNEWRTKWVQGCEHDGLNLGLNWSGKRATGYDVEPAVALSSLSARESRN